MSGGPNLDGWINRVVGWCFSIFFGSLALYGAVLLIRCIWPWLLIGVVIVGAVVAISWAVVQWRRF